MAHPGPSWRTITTPYEQLFLKDGEGALAFSRDHGILYVTREYDIQLVDPLRGTVIDQYAFSRAPEVACTSLSDRYAYARGMLSSTVQVIDIQTHTVQPGCPIGVLSGGMDASPDGRLLYVAARESRDNANGALLIIDSATQTLTNKVDIGKNPASILSHPNEPYAYIICAGVSGEGSGLYIVNTQSCEAIHIPIVGERGYLALTPDGERLYIAQHHTQRITVIDTHAHQPLCEFAVSQNPNQIALSHDQKWLYMLSTDSQIRIFNTATLQLARTIDTAVQPLRGIKTHPSNNTVTIAYRNDDLASQARPLPANEQ